jgi:hypothetical protein
MMKLNTLLCAALALPVVAHADVSVQGSFGTPVFTVIDLDPDDGVTPVFTWTPTSVVYALGLWDEATGEIDVKTNLDLGTGNVINPIDPASPFSDQGMVSHASATVSYVPSDKVSLQVLVSGSSNFQGGIGLQGVFSLNGNATVKIEIPYSSTLNCGSGDCLGGAQFDAYTISEYGGASYNSTVPSVFAPSMQQGTLTNMDITNTSNSTLTGSFSYVVDSQVVALPVPEPETWSMLLAGIGLVGVAARQRSA